MKRLLSLVLILALTIGCIPANAASSKSSSSSDDSMSVFIASEAVAYYVTDVIDNEKKLKEKIIDFVFNEDSEQVEATSHYKKFKVRKNLVTYLDACETYLQAFFYAVNLYSTGKSKTSEFTSIVEYLTICADAYDAIFDIWGFKEFKDKLKNDEDKYYRYRCQDIEDLLITYLDGK